MNELKHCGLCGTKNTYKAVCWQCEQRGDRFTRNIQKKLNHIHSKGSVTQ